MRLLRQAELAASRGETRLASRAWTSDGILPDALDACHRLVTETRRRLLCNSSRVMGAERSAGGSSNSTVATRPGCGP